MATTESRSSRLVGGRSGEGPAPDLSIGLIAFAPQPWGTAWTSRHHVCISLARSFPTVWLSPAPEWRRARPWRHPPPEVLGPIPSIPNFIVDHPHWNDLTIYSPERVGRHLARRRLERVAEGLRRRGCRRLVAYLWRARFLKASQLYPFDCTVIHLDDEHSFAEQERPVSELEADALRQADLAFLSSPQLFDRKGGFNPNSFLFPNGVDLAWYRDRQPEPEDLARIPRPRLGYTGFLRRMLDWPLLVSLAERHPEWQLVFVGGQAGHDLPPDVERLRALPNAHFLGYRPSRQMVAYQQHFEVGLLPYSVTPYTDCIYPVKLHEYLAAGSPVVGSPIRSLLDFSDEILIARELPQWEMAIQEALRPEQREPGRIAARGRTAAGFDWDRMSDAAARLIVNRLEARVMAGPPRADR